MGDGGDGGRGWVLVFRGLWVDKDGDGNGGQEM